MRTVVSVGGFLCVVLCCSVTQSQIPENAQFQPGSYAFGPNYSRQNQQPAAVMAAVAVDGEEQSGEATSRSEWEKQFSPQHTGPTQVLPPSQPYEVPHLSWSYDYQTHRFHLVPYEPGYAANPSAFPQQTSPLNIWVSSGSSAAQPNPQVQYMSYHDPDPVILPAEIRLRTSRFGAKLTNLQPMPMPVPRPEHTELLSQPRRTRIGEQFRQNTSPFIVK